ncbi:MAG: hypothetical protein JNG90_07935 [Planctomycetaceae bacterium]|nr:hypothetical protein [Planctomycetaceae bacterium]
MHQTFNYLLENTHPRNWCFAYAESVVGQLRVAQANFPEAEGLLAKGLQDLRRSRGDYSPHTHIAATALVDFYMKHDRSAEAAHYEPLLKLPEPIEIEYEPLTP